MQNKLALQPFPVLQVEDFCYSLLLGWGAPPEIPSVIPGTCREEIPMLSLSKFHGEDIAPPENIKEFSGTVQGVAAACTYISNQ